MFTYLDLGRPHRSLFNIDKPFGNLIFSLLFWSISLWAPTDWLDNVQVCPQKITGCEEGEVRPARIFYQFVIFFIILMQSNLASFLCLIFSCKHLLQKHLAHLINFWLFVFPYTSKRGENSLNIFSNSIFEHTYIQADLPNKIKNHPGWILQKGCESSSEGDPTNDYTQQSPWP